MKVINTTIPEVLIFEPIVHGDDRGYFIEYFRQEIIDKQIPGTQFVQGNESLSSYGVIRGLHFQKPPYAQGKLVRVITGEVVDVAVDLRIGSPTYGQHVAVILSGENKRQLWIPRGFAHGFGVLSDKAIFAYKCDNTYHPEADGGIRFDDPTVNIQWPIDPSLIRLSAKDKILPGLKEVDCFMYEDFKTTIQTNANQLIK